MKTCRYGTMRWPATMRRAVVLLAWWFVMLGAEQGGRIIGPFKRQEDCNMVRQQVAETAFGNPPFRRFTVTNCWEG